MTRRRAPRRAAAAVGAAQRLAAPLTPLAAVQGVWVRAVGPQLAAAAEPISERDGEVLIGCASAVWAEELDMMQEQLLGRLREELGEGAPRRLRFRARPPDGNR